MRRFSGGEGVVHLTTTKQPAHEDLRTPALCLSSHSLRLAYPVMEGDNAALKCPASGQCPTY